MLRASSEDNSGRLTLELRCSKHAQVMHTSKVQPVAGRLEAGGMARREAMRELEAGDVLRRDAIHGLKAHGQQEQDHVYLFRVTFMI